MELSSPPYLLVWFCGEVWLWGVHCLRRCKRGSERVVWWPITHQGQTNQQQQINNITKYKIHNPDRLQFHDIKDHRFAKHVVAKVHSDCCGTQWLLWPLCGILTRLTLFPLSLSTAMACLWSTFSRGIPLTLMTRSLILKIDDTWHDYITDGIYTHDVIIDPKNRRYIAWLYYWW